jgi:hypothetical protein
MKMLGKFKAKRIRITSFFASLDISMDSYLMFYLVSDEVYDKYLHIPELLFYCNAMSIRYINTLQ